MLFPSCVLVSLLCLPFVRSMQPMPAIVQKGAPAGESSGFLARADVTISLVQQLDRRLPMPVKPHPETGNMRQTKKLVSGLLLEWKAGRTMRYDFVRDANGFYVDKNNLPALFFRELVVKESRRTTVNAFDTRYKFDEFDPAVIEIASLRLSSEQLHREIIRLLNRKVNSEPTYPRYSLGALDPDVASRADAPFGGSSAFIKLLLAALKVPVPPEVMGRLDGAAEYDANNMAARTQAVSGFIRQDMPTARYDTTWWKKPSSAKVNWWRRWQWNLLPESQGSGFHENADFDAMGIGKS
ncbi:MAG: hypothetical protein M1833_004753 [Piccolia ochrophora]|nr:MAG: hypothetical protein M1833_004753 [Piccolia ochrophora]